MLHNTLRVQSISTLLWELRKGVLGEVTYKLWQEDRVGVGQENTEEGVCANAMGSPIGVGDQSLIRG